MIIIFIIIMFPNGPEAQTPITFKPNSIKSVSKPNKPAFPLPSAQAQFQTQPHQHRTWEAQSQT